MGGQDALEDRLADNYHDLQDFSLFKEVNDFLRQYPNPNSAPLKYGTLGMKFITKFVRVGMNQSSELHKSLGVTYDEQTITAAKEYTLEAITRIVEGTAKHEDFDHTENRLIIMKGHLHNDAGKFYHNLATRADDKRELLSEARNHFSDGISICSRVDPFVEGFAYVGRAEVSIDMADIEDAEAWLNNALDDFERGAWILSDYDKKRAMRARERKTAVAMRLAEMGNEFKWLMFACNEYLACARGYKEIGDERSAFTVSQSAEILKTIAFEWYNVQDLDTLEKVCYEFIEAADELAERDPSRAFNLYSVSGEIAETIGMNKQEDAESWFNGAQEAFRSCIKLNISKEMNARITGRIANMSMHIANLYNGPKKLSYLSTAYNDYLHASNALREHDQELAIRYQKIANDAVREMDHIRAKQKRRKGKKQRGIDVDPKRRLPKQPSKASQRLVKLDDV